MDRNLTLYSQYGHFLGQTGARRARLQGGWAHCEPVRGGPYNWPWLDEAVFGVAAQGIKPWVEFSYGNPAYGPGAGGIGLPSR